MLSIGIIWNSANRFKKEIIKDLNEKMNVLRVISLDLKDKYFDFVRDIYASENMEQEKIDKKIEHMIVNPNTSITIIFFEFNEDKIEYHPFKKKNVYTELENCKRYIREKYKPYIEEYTFDIIFHATDNLVELNSCYNVLTLYLEKILPKERNELILKMQKYKDLSREGQF